MRKVGIMSMQRIANYGSFLQAYALKQLIEELGHKVEFVDYHVGAPVIAENADSKNKFVRKLEKGLETFQYQAPLTHKLSFMAARSRWLKPSAFRCSTIAVTMAAISSVSSMSFAMTESTAFTCSL